MLGRRCIQVFVEDWGASQGFKLFIGQKIKKSPLYLIYRTAFDLRGAYFLFSGSYSEKRGMSQGGTVLLNR